MNKQGNIFAIAVVFFVAWILAMLIWSFWLDGIAVPLFGVLTAGLLVGGVTVAINWSN